MPDAARRGAADPLAVCLKMRSPFRSNALRNNSQQENDSRLMEDEWKRPQFLGR
jgi:hypothetical protein